MKHWACLCGFRDETATDKPPLCLQCNADMYGYAPPFHAIGDMVRPIIQRAISKAKRGRG